MSKDKLTVTFHIRGAQVDKLTAEQCEHMAEKLSDTMNIYYTAHSDEYSKLISEKSVSV